jgi:tetratricopeptide (TPR) repeat protein
MVGSSRSLWLTVFFGLALFAGPPAVSQTAGKRLAVLEFSGAKIQGDVLDIFADTVRGGVVDGLAGRGVQVLSRENMMVLLKEMGKKACGEGDCEVETARNIGVDFVVSGSVVLIDQSFVVTLKLHETKGGSLLAVDQAAAPTQVEVLRQLREAGRKIVADNVGPRPTVSTARLSAAMAGSNEPPLRFTFSLRGQSFTQEQIRTNESEISRLERLVASTGDDDPAKLALHFSLAERYRDQYGYLSVTTQRYDDQARQRAVQAAIRQYVLVSKHPEFDRMDDVLCQIAQLLEHIGKPDQAREFFHRLIKNYPKSKYVPDSYLVFGEYYFAKGEMENASKFYDKVAQFPQSSVFGFAVYKKAMTQMSLGNFKAALTAFVFLLELCRSDKIPQGQHARLEGAAKRGLVNVYARTPGAAPEKAWDFFQRMGGPAAFTMLDALADLYRQQGMRDEASRVCRKLVELKPDVPRRCD